ncbi:MAG: hypothetical protein V1774_03315 [Candidatus Eisenbacteria bacterium]
MSLAPLLESGWRALLDCFAPLRCPLCGSRLESDARCRCCAIPLAAAARRQLRSDREGEFLLIAGGTYEGPLRRLVHAFKYGRDPGALQMLASQATRALPETRGWQALVPVPGHRRRVRERGWEPVMDLAVRVGGAGGLPVRRVLTRVLDTPPLTGRPAGERRCMVRDAFRAVPVDGDLLVLDDVATTGATFRACRSALLGAGARGVDLLVVAATPRRFF